MATQSSAFRADVRVEVTVRGIAYWTIRALPAMDGFVLAWLMAAMVDWGTAADDPGALLTLLLVIPATQLVLTRSGVYDSHRLEKPHDIVTRVLLAHCGAAVLIAGAGALLTSFETLVQIGLVLLSSFFALSLEKFTIHSILQPLRRRGFDARSVLFVGSWEQAREFAEGIGSHPEWGFRLEAVAVGSPRQREFLSYPGGESYGCEAESLLKQRVIDEVLIQLGSEPLPHSFGEAREFEQYGLEVRAVVQPVSERSIAGRASELGRATSLSIVSSSRTEKQLAIKRIFDFLVASFLLLAAAPVMLVIAFVVKATSRGPVFFVQTRVGLNGRRFRMFKFRTMVDGAELLVRQAHRSITNGPVFKDPQDYRITSVGRFLRKFSLDELPQLLNVLRGEMSIVGPRPLPEYEAERIEGAFRRRFSVPPGLTCLWQVSGRSNVAYEAWMRYDLEYVDHWSLWSDTVLLLKTIPVVFAGRGGY